jgi:hypothetical protein
MKMFAKNGLPLKVSTQWTEDTYTQNNRYDSLTHTEVAGWLVRINGFKYPRDDFDEGDYTVRYTPKEGRTPEGRMKAIEQALKDGGYK